MHYSVYDSSANIHTLLVAEPTGRALGFYLTGFNRVFLPPVFFFFSGLLSVMVPTPPFLGSLSLSKWNLAQFVTPHLQNKWHRQQKKERTDLNFSLTTCLLNCCATGASQKGSEEQVWDTPVGQMRPAGLGVQALAVFPVVVDQPLKQQISSRSIPSCINGCVKI